MSKILNIISLAIIALTAISCDPVSEDERFSKAEGINPERKVLVQEFTGQFCPNCPLGHEALDNIAKQYGENAVIVSIHSGDMAFDDPDFGLKTPDGDAYAKEWGIQQYPSAVVNRKGVMSDRSQWQGAVFMAGLTAPKVKIALNTQMNDGKLDITADLIAEETMAGAHCQLWIVEDNIVTLQQDGEDYIMEYVHNHVYRSSPNGIGGTEIGDVTSKQVTAKGISLDSRWNSDNLKVVAFVYTDKDVLQAEEVKVVK